MASAGGQDSFAECLKRLEAEHERNLARCRELEAQLATTKQELLASKVAFAANGDAKPLQVVTALCEPRGADQDAKTGAGPDRAAPRPQPIATGEAKADQAETIKVTGRNGVPGSNIPRTISAARIRANVRKKFNSKRYSPISASKRIATTSTHLKSLVESRTFEMTSIGLVLANAAWVGWAVQHNATHDGKSVIQDPVDLVFCCAFTLEFGTRLLAALTEGGCLGGCFTYWSVPWNLFDFVIVGVMILEQILQFSADDETKGQSSIMSQMSVLRVLRIARIVRVLRVIRLLRFFRELRILILSIVSAVQSLVWAGGVLVLMFYIFGVSITMGVVEYSRDESNGVFANSHPLIKNFGSLDVSLLSLCESMMGGVNWGILVEELKPVGGLYVFIFITFIAFAILAVMNIVTGVFVDTAMKNSLHDRDMIIEAQMEEKEAYLKQMEDVFYELDGDGDGTVNFEEFQAAIGDERMTAYFRALQLDVTDVETLFVLLDKDRTGSIEIQEFICGCLRLRGEAKNLDLAKLLLENEWMVHNMERLIDNIQRQYANQAPQPMSPHSRTVRKRITQISKNGSKAIQLDPALLADGEQSEENPVQEPAPDLPSESSSKGASSEPFLCL